MLKTSTGFAIAAIYSIQYANAILSTSIRRVCQCCKMHHMRMSGQATLWNTQHITQKRLWLWWYCQCWSTVPTGSASDFHPSVFVFVIISCFHTITCSWAWLLTARKGPWPLAWLCSISTRAVHRFLGSLLPGWASAGRQFEKGPYFAHDFLGSSTVQCSTVQYSQGLRIREIYCFNRLLFCGNAISKGRDSVQPTPHSE